MRSKYSYAPEPLIVEDTAALDRALETGRFRHPDPEPMPSVQRPRIGSRTDFNSHSPSSSSSDASGFERSEPGSPRLGHASREITTQQQQQQQRRRSTKIAPGPSQSAQTLSVTATRRGGSPRALSPTSLMPPPRKAQDTSAVTVNISHTSRMPAAPESLFDATIRSEALKTDPTAGRKSQFRKSALNQSRQPLNDVANRVTAGPSKSTLAPTPAKKSTPWDNGASVHLPDITGLTAAIASPNKPGISYYEPAADGSQSGTFFPVLNHTLRSD